MEIPCCEGASSSVADIIAAANAATLRKPKNGNGWPAKDAKGREKMEL